MHQLIGRGSFGIELDQRLLVGQTDRDFEHARFAAECFCDRAGAQRAVQASDVGAYAAPIRPAGGSSFQGFGVDSMIAAVFTMAPHVECGALVNLGVHPKVKRKLCAT